MVTKTRSPLFPPINKIQISWTLSTSWRAAASIPTRPRAAYGAAVQAAMLSGEASLGDERWRLVHGVTGLSLSVWTGSGSVTLLFPWNTTLPGYRRRRIGSSTSSQTLRTSLTSCSWSTWHLLWNLVKFLSRPSHIISWYLSKFHNFWTSFVFYRTYLKTFHLQVHGHVSWTRYSKFRIP